MFVALGLQTNPEEGKMHLKVFIKESGGSGSHLSSQHFGRPRRADHLRSEVQDQPGQHGETPSLKK